jgi:energy-coupling factor transporter transmembrane protein EcfT
MVIALSIIPQLVISVQRVRLAQRMRGIKKIGLTNWRFLAAPVIEESLERAVDLATNLENKGFGFHQNPTQFAPIKFGINERLLVISSIYLFLLSFADFSNWYLLALAILSVLISTQLIVQNNFRVHQPLIGRKF